MLHQGWRCSLSDDDYPNLTLRDPGGRFRAAADAMRVSAPYLLEDRAVIIRAALELGLRALSEGSQSQAAVLAALAVA